MPADNGLTSTLIMVALMVAAFYVLIILPARRKQREQQNLVSSLAEGSRVMTTAGILGTIRHLGTNQAIIEIAPGVEMTVLKQAIVRTVSPSDEEFEYDDEEADVDEADDDLDTSDHVALEASVEDAPATDARADEGK